MALVTRLQESKSQEKSNDITRNLTSLQFESGLNDEEKELLVLRARNHAISVTQCALVTVIVDIMKKTKEMLMGIKNPETKRTAKILHDEAGLESLNVGIIGCGRLGSQIAHCLLTYGRLHPSKLQISTRRPETLEYLQNRGVDCYYNNERLVSSANLVIFCVLPAHMNTIADEIKDYIHSSLIMICPFSSTPLRRLRQMLFSSNVIRPVLCWPEDNAVNDYNYGINVNTALEYKEIVQTTCPVGIDKADLLVSADERLLETIVLAVANMCTDSGLSQSQTLTVIHHAVLGETNKKPLTCDKLSTKHFSEVVRKKKDKKDNEDSDKSFPFFDLVDAHEKGSPIRSRLSSSQSIQMTFLSRYCHVFEDYVYKKAYGQLN